MSVEVIWHRNCFCDFNYEMVLVLWQNIRKYNDWTNLREVTEGVHGSVVLMIKEF